MITRLLTDDVVEQMINKYDFEGKYEVFKERDIENFLNTYKAFICAQGFDYRARFLPAQIERLEWDNLEQTFNIHFEHTWFHFTSDHKWY